ncbi:hypothetical protein SPRG_02190 [Saprolegnia parasitica CBS 223.65]|uniref:Uncharacterized protein n=1 Tax=Saprolegnia parasitica (strain CBS 223.65) TaxID=695850 RepID=A0A067CS97_SAPPC|nr:hypothetical protein SPRG_02190 [Saprolegnia parasitica CBS 223.65]KDO33383.1 hypothetical protein SPRG_02190 [Saprolegnia parasitica CBS 223.65]|eukprot:XP_012196131.1 hypothetical protein SPRG_02190 [Saprolegnia parasitica CBS 223.65]
MQMTAETSDDDALEAFLRDDGVPSPNLSTDHDAISDLASIAVVIPSYVDHFDVLVPAAEVVVGSVSPETLAAQEAELEAARLAQAQADASAYIARESLLAYKEKQTKKRLEAQAQAHKTNLAKRELQSLRVVELQSKKLTQVFQHAESHMKNVLGQQQAHVRDTYGDATARTPIQTRRYRAEWAKIPQPVELHLHMLRAPKDKLPQGHYVLLATLYDRLGGNPISWGVAGERGIGRDYPGITRPIFHRGHFYNTELSLDQSIFCVCPSELDLRPANVVILELYLLSGASAMHDTVVGWAALPACTTDFTILEGRFKVPMLRGDIDHTITKYHDIERMYTMDLGAWLCNVYLTAKHLPRERLDDAGVLQREYDVEVDFMNQLLKLETTDRALLHKEEYAAAMGGGVVQTKPKSQHLADHVSWGHAAAELQSARHRKPKAGSSNKVLPGVPESAPALVEAPSKLKTPRKKRSWQSWFRRRSTKSKPLLVRSMVDETIELLEPRSPRATDESESNDANNDDEDTPAVPPNDMHAWEGFSFTTNRHLDETVAKHQRFAVYRKLRYLKQELFADLGLAKASTLQFWLMLSFLLLAFWLRVYVHYLGQWLYLRSANVPVFTFEPALTTCVLKYIWSTVPSVVEVVCICAGVVFNMLAFLLLMLVAYVCQRVLGDFPELGSRFIACFGLGTVLDPALIFLVDLLSHNYACANLPECVDPSSALCTCAEGDAFKLYARYVLSEGTGIVGAVLTLLLYGILMSLAAVLFYTYLLHLHMNGRMLDVYRRVHARQGTFFVPHDFEVSAAEVRKLCDRASRWKSMHGAQRKTAVCEYELRDPLDPTFVETTVHIAIFTLELDGSRQLYRHFIQNPDGEILEVFGALSDSFGSQYASLETALFQTQPDVATPGLFDTIV